MPTGDSIGTPSHLSQAIDFFVFQDHAMLPSPGLSPINADPGNSGDSIPVSLGALHQRGQCTLTSKYAGLFDL